MPTILVRRGDGVGATGGTMLVATFGPSTGWAGKTITYDNGQFTLEDFGPVTVRDVLSYHERGQLIWAYEGLQEWVEEQSEPRAPARPAMGAALGRDGRQVQQKKSGFPSWAVALIVVGVLLAIGAVVVFPMMAGEDEKKRESDVKMGVHSLQIGIQSYAVDHDDAYPDPSLLTRAGMETYLTHWPTNPYTGMPMAQGSGPGDFSYTVSPDGASFLLTGHGVSVLGSGVRRVPEWSP
jgi:hypothetical protein